MFIVTEYAALMFINSDSQVSHPWPKGPYYAWVKVFRINPELRILRLIFYRKSASKC